MDSPCSFSKKNVPILPLDQKSAFQFMRAGFLWWSLNHWLQRPLLDQKPAPNSDSFRVRRLFNVLVQVFCAPNATILLVYIPAKIKISFIWKDNFFCQNRRLTSTPETIELCMASYQGLHAKFVSMMSPKFSIVQNDGELMLMVLHTHFLPQHLGVRTVFGLSRFGLSMKMPVSFSFFTRFFTIFAHILQHYHDFQSNVAVFPSIIQAYTQPYSFGGRIKLIILQIKYELNVTIHEISTIWKKKR